MLEDMSSRRIGGLASNSSPMGGASTTGDSLTSGTAEFERRNLLAGTVLRKQQSGPVLALMSVFVPYPRFAPDSWCKVVVCPFPNLAIDSNSISLLPLTPAFPHRSRNIFEGARLSSNGHSLSPRACRPHPARGDLEPGNAGPD